MLYGAAVYSFGVLMWHLFTCQVAVVAPLGSCGNWSSMYLLHNRPGLGQVCAPYQYNFSVP